MTELVLSLFPGLDVLGMGFELEGFCVVAGPDVVWGRDVRTFKPPAGKFDGIVGGDPCQSHSTLANLVRAKGLEPRFGDLTPEFARVVEEARPAWFLRENTPLAPDIAPKGYAVTPFLLHHEELDAGNGFGNEQTRTRRFWFGWPEERGPAPNLKGRIRHACLLLPKASRASTVQGGNDATPGNRRKTSEVLAERRVRRDAVTTRTGKPPGPGFRKRTVSQCSVNNHPAVKARKRAVAHDGGGAWWDQRNRRVPSVTGAHTCAERPKGGHGERYSLEEMLRLQGLPADCLEHAPFTMTGKRKLVGNAVPLNMARELARAVREVMG